jgi:hypothetical protein
MPPRTPRDPPKGWDDQRRRDLLRRADQNERDAAQLDRNAKRQHGEEQAASRRLAEELRKGANKLRSDAADEGSAR